MTTVQQISSALMLCKDTGFGMAIKRGVSSGNIQEVIDMIIEQSLEDKKSVEMCIGAGTLSKIKSL